MDGRGTDSRMTKVAEGKEYVCTLHTHTYAKAAFWNTGERRAVLVLLSPPHTYVRQRAGLLCCTAPALPSRLTFSGTHAHSLLLFCPISPQRSGQRVESQAGQASCSSCRAHTLRRPRAARPAGPATGSPAARFSPRTAPLRSNTPLVRCAAARSCTPTYA